ncbi:hypothetical protein HN51_037509 [Arachis hypogaea]
MNRQILRFVGSLSGFGGKIAKVRNIKDFMTKAMQGRKSKCSSHAFALLPLSLTFSLCMKQKCNESSCSVPFSTDGCEGSLSNKLSN